MFKKAQSVTEYTVVIACIVASLAVMQAYFRRGLSGQIKVQVDQMGRQFDPSQGNLRAVSSHSEDSIEVTRSQYVQLDNDNGFSSENRKGQWHEMVYSVVGPGGVEDEEGNWIISPDGNRSPLTMTNYQESSVDWENLNLAE